MVTGIKWFKGDHINENRWQHFLKNKILSSIKEVQAYLNTNAWIRFCCWTICFFLSPLLHRTNFKSLSDTWLTSIQRKHLCSGDYNPICFQFIMHFHSFSLPLSVPTSTPVFVFLSPSVVIGWFSLTAFCWYKSLLGVEISAACWRTLL